MDTPKIGKLTRAVRRLDDEGGKAATLRERYRESRRSRQAHRLELDALAEERMAETRARKERRADIADRADLDALYRKAKISGERARVRHALLNSGEVRALRVQKVRTRSLQILIPVMMAFAAWSTIGVQKGVTKVLQAEHGDSVWYGAWGVEPALIAVVALIIIVRAVLRSAGGDLKTAATWIEFIALSTSIVLNLAGAWPSHIGWSSVPALLAHSVGPIGTAGTAFLIGVIDDSVSQCDPFKGVPQGQSVPRPAQTSRPAVPAPVSRPDVPQERPSEMSQDERPAVPSPEARPAIERPVPASRPAAVPSRPKVRPAQPSRPVDGDTVKLVIETFERRRSAGEKTSVREIANATGVSKSAVGRYLAAHLAQPVMSGE